VKPDISTWGRRARFYFVLTRRGLIRTRRYGRAAGWLVATKGEYPFWGTYLPLFAARATFIFFLLWLLEVKPPFIVRAPLEEVAYQTNGMTAVMVARAWVLQAWFAGEWDKRWLGFATGHNGVRIARVLYALALIAFGLSHFF
jgi:hypothetical protein